VILLHQASQTQLAGLSRSDTPKRAVHGIELRRDNIIPGSALAEANINGSDRIVVELLSPPDSRKFDPGTQSDHLLAHDTGVACCDAADSRQRIVPDP
jgi:hypothetical protein